MLTICRSTILNTNDIESEENGWNILSAGNVSRYLWRRGLARMRGCYFIQLSLSAACRVAFVAYWLGISEKNLRGRANFMA